MKMYAKVLAGVVAAGVLTGSVFGMEGGLDGWSEKGLVVRLSEKEKLSESLQKVLAQFNFEEQKYRKVESFDDLNGLVAANEAIAQMKNSGAGISLEVLKGILQKRGGDSTTRIIFTLIRGSSEEKGSDTLVLQMKDEDGKVQSWIINFARKLWLPPMWEELNGKRYPYYIPACQTYYLRVAKVIEERGLTRVSVPESYLILLNNDEEPTDDNSCLAVERVDGFCEAFSVLKDAALIYRASALQLISELMQVIYFAGLWDASTNVFLHADEKASIIGLKPPSLGGNPWVFKQGETAPIKPWLPLIEAGENKIKGDGGYGLRQLWELLFNIEKDKLFTSPWWKLWFETNVVKGGELVANEKAFFDIRNIHVSLNMFQTQCI